MRLLTQKEWENPKYKNEGLTTKMLNSFIDEVFANISYICNIKNYSQEIFGVAMTLFHYYTYLKNFNEYDRAEISVSCVFLACKIEFSFFKTDEAKEIFTKLKKGMRSSIPDFTIFEVDILAFLGYEMDISTPHKYFYFYLEKNRPNLLSHPKIMNLGMKIINDNYRSNTCIFHHPKYIALGAVFITLNIITDHVEKVEELKDFLLWDNNLSFKYLTLCVDSLVTMFENRISDAKK